MEQVPIEDFKAAIPELKQLEARLQNIDMSLGEPARNYLQEIMDEIKAESAIEDNLISEIDRLSKAITAELFDTVFSLDNFAFEYRNVGSAQWVEFYGYKEAQLTDGTLLVVKEVFRSVCYKMGLIFIDSSLSDK